MPLKTTRLTWKVSMQSLTFKIIFGSVKKTEESPKNRVPNMESIEISG